MIVQRDINSAYPWAFTQLPCLTHGVWYRTSSAPISGIWLAKVRFAHSSETTLCHFPMRDRTGRISFPRSGTGWYWSPEVLAAVRGGADVRQIGQGWGYDQSCDCRPFDFVPDLYAERQLLGKTGRGLVIKLSLNSLYGKSAQSIGRAPWANPIYAGLCTSLVRARLIDDYMRIGPERCVMLATDGVFYLADHADGFDVGTELGQWEEILHEEMFIIQPGLYFVSSDMGHPKTRGVPRIKVVEQRGDFERAWREQPSVGAAVEIPIRQFVGLRLAHARGKPETAGRWVEVSKRVAFDWRSKRRSDLRCVDGVYRSLPLDGRLDMVTVPYDRMIGGNTERAQERWEDEDSPDWAEQLMLGNVERMSNGESD